MDSPNTKKAQGTFFEYIHSGNAAMYVGYEVSVSCFAQNAEIYT